MKEIILVLPLIAGLFFIFSGPALAEYGSKGSFHKDKQEKWKQRKQEQKEKNREPMKSPGGKTQEEKSTDTKAYREEERQDKKNFYEKARNYHISAIKEKLSANNKLNPEEKDELIGFYEEQYREKASWRGQDYDKNTGFLEGLADSGMTQEEMKAAVERHFQDQKTGKKMHWKKQRFEKKSKKKELGREYKEKSGEEKAR